AHRVGRWSCWVTARLSDYAQTEVQDQIHLDATWRFHPPLDAYWADCSGLNVDDRGWEAISLPHRWDAGRDGTDGYAWYRHEVIVPADWQGQTIVVRCEGVDDEALVYVNGHEVGFCEGSR